jgi:ubiquinone/menaquinone biosynthesis C-methylase UbiE
VSRKAYFNQAAETWDQKYITPELEAFLEDLVPRFGLRHGQRVLDLGTGTGVLIPFLFRLVGPSGSVTAIDYAEKMVHACRIKYSNLRNVVIELQDLEELSLPSESFDAVTCFGLFPHLENKEKALRQMNRVLAQGGRLIIAHALSSAEIRRHHKDSLPVVHDVLPEKEEMRRLLERAGFSLIQITDEPGFYLCIATKTLETATTAT